MTCKPAEPAKNVAFPHAMKPFLLRRLAHRKIWSRIFNERLTEPLHMNFLSLFVWVFGSYRAKVDYDLVVRQNNAYGSSKLRMRTDLGIWIN